MEFLQSVLHFFLHLDDHLHAMILDYGAWIYAILFLIIFVETGLVVMPFLPGDSLLFAAGTFCAGVTNEAGQSANLNLFLVLGLLIVAAILGDGLNYLLGKKVGLRMLQMKLRGKQLVNQKYIDQTHAFYEKHGPKTIIIARFVPIVRTFAPFVAGIGEMSYSKFIRFNVIGGVVWVLALTLAGYFFGGLDFVKENFETVIFGIIGISILPMVIEIIRAKLKK
ncbi:MAG: DedA family protein [Crocinitomicaceae bacterium]|nr:MAG: DedA family protein [Crocinitomicaceae bacterium]